MGGFIDDLDQAVFHAYGWDNLWQRLHPLEGHASACPRTTNDSPNTASAIDEDKASQATTAKRTQAPAIRDESRESVEAELLERLVALNHQRAEEEAQGQIRWLRPEFQNPDGERPQQGELEVAAPQKKAATKAKAAKLKWPAELSGQVAALRQLLAEAASANDPAALSGHFGRKSAAREDQIRQILETLEALGAL